ncbi:MAG TPA: hypothetical protein VLW17_10225, partial [Thermoanaerobaculaceae bacterium]|nr:hypothetical protein [Thermoanaerobaculaceae bacterium]
FRVELKGDQNNGCGGPKLWTLLNFAGWQDLGEDVHGVVRDPGFRAPGYPNDDYSLPGGTPGVGFVPFDPNLAGRSDPEIMPPAVAATFPTETFNPATGY